MFGQYRRGKLKTGLQLVSLALNSPLQYPGVVWSSRCGHQTPGTHAGHGGAAVNQGTASPTLLSDWNSWKNIKCGCLVSDPVVGRKETRRLNLALIHLIWGVWTLKWFHNPVISLIGTKLGLLYFGSLAFYYSSGGLFSFWVISI